MLRINVYLLFPFLAGFVQEISEAAESSRPNIILVMADDQGWGETGYYKHPVLNTPELDGMAANSLRFDRDPLLSRLGTTRPANSI